MRISRNTRRATALVVIAACSGLSAFGCSAPGAGTGESGDSSTGSIGLELQAGGVVLSAVQYTIVGNGFSKTGALNVANSTQISGVIGGIPAGNGYSLTLSAAEATDASTTCSGSTAFNVIAGATTSAQVHLLCKVPPRTGSVSVNGTINVCPNIDSVSLEPAETTVGNSVALTAVAHDSDNAPSSLTYVWTTSSGTLAGALTANAALACTTPGTATVTLIVSDGDCSDSATQTVTCSAAASGSGGASSGGAPGSAGSGGSLSGAGGAIGSGGAAGSAGSGGASATLGPIRINEVESNGDVTDWCELYNAGSAPVDISGWIFRDNDDTHGYVIPSGTVVAAGAYYVLDQSAFSFGLGAPDMTRLFLADGITPVDSYSWTVHAAVTYGRCPNGTGDFVNTVSSTKGAPNDCGNIGGSGGASGSGGTGGSDGSTAGAGGSASAFITWPGQNQVAIVDSPNEFGANDPTATDGTNMSGLFYEPGASGSPDVMWAVQNGPSKIYRLIWNGSIWATDTANNWSSGHTISYVSGTGGPDSEGITKTDFGGPSVYVSTERDNDNKTVPLLKVLLLDGTATTATVNATREWDLTPDYNQTTADANLGLEAIAWVPDTYLVSKGFIDESTGTAYDPGRYPNHAAGIFFVGLEKDGSIRGYALNHSDSSFTRVATFVSGNPAIMDLSFDRETGYLWAACDNTCNGRTNVLDIDTRPGSPTLGRFYIRQGFEKPSTMVSGSVTNMNNEGFTVTPESTCVGGFKSVFYSDDDNDAGHALRRDSIPCGMFLN